MESQRPCRRALLAQEVGGISPYGKRKKKKARLLPIQQGKGGSPRMRGFKTRGAVGVGSK